MINENPTLGDEKILTDNEIIIFVEKVVNNFFEFSNYRVNLGNWLWCAWKCWPWEQSSFVCEAKCRNLRKYDLSIKDSLIEDFSNKLIKEKNNWNFNIDSIRNYILPNYINIKIKDILNKQI